MDNHEHCAGLVREGDRDRYLADLFAPAAARRHLFALHAFAVELARVRERVSEPQMGEIRLQWWRDALATGDSGGHPVAAALLETVAACNLPVAALVRAVEARLADLFDDAMPTLHDLEAYAGETRSAFVQLSALVLAGADPGSAAAAGEAGVAMTLVEVLSGLPRAPRRWQAFLPEELLAAHGVDRGALLAGRLPPGLDRATAELAAVARRRAESATAALARLPVAVLPAFLPLALVGPRLARIARRAPDLPAWRRQWLLWRAASRLGRR
jgi:phytoene synthase